MQFLTFLRELQINCFTISIIWRWWDRETQLTDTTRNLLVREESFEMAKEVFEGTSVSVTEKGKRYLWAATGTQSLVESYVKRKVSEWVNTVERLSTIAHTQPCAFMHGLMSKWTYLTNLTNLLSPLEFLTLLTGQNAFNDVRSWHCQ